MKNLKFDLRKGAKIKIVPNQKINYYNFNECFIENGFKPYDEYLDFEKNIKFQIYEKDSKLYRALKVNHYNSQIYDFTMQELVEV